MTHSALKCYPLKTQISSPLFRTLHPTHCVKSTSVLLSQRHPPAVNKINCTPTRQIPPKQSPVIAPRLWSHFTQAPRTARRWRRRPEGGRLPKNGCRLSSQPFLTDFAHLHPTISRSKCLREKNRGDDQRCSSSSSSSFEREREREKGRGKKAAAAASPLIYPWWGGEKREKRSERVR